MTHLRRMWRLQEAIVILAIAILCGCSADERSSPTETEPYVPDLSGRWAAQFSSGPCHQTWHRVRLQLQQHRGELSGQLTPDDGPAIGVRGTVSDLGGQIQSFGPFSDPNCVWYGFYFTVEVDPSGYAESINGWSQGRCCGTVAGVEIHFTRGS